jgi:protocatechuate 3,4-dioxygenase beta subunit
MLAVPGFAREPIVGGPCDGCEAVFEGQPATLTSEARLVEPGEAGRPLRVEGRTLDAEGRPRAGVVVYAYQTDASGIYRRVDPAPGAAARRHGALRGWALTDADGRYAFSTVRPGSYPDSEIPAHIHLHVIERACATYYIDDIVFTDDPLLTAARRPRYEHGRGGSGVVTPQARDGHHVVVRDIRLGAGIADYPGCE